MSLTITDIKGVAPKLRFPEFKKDWGDTKVNKILERVSNPVDVEPSANYQEIGIRSHGKGIFHKEPVTGEKLGNKRVFHVEKHAFIVNIVFAWEHAVAITTEAEGDMIASHRFPMYRGANEDINIEYVTRFFLTNRGKYLLGLASPGGAGRNKTLGQKAFEELDVRIPQLEEQAKISKFLTVVDERILGLVKKKCLLEAYKKGAMQNLFSQQIRFTQDDGTPFSDWEEKKLGEISNRIATKNTDETIVAVLTNSATKGIVNQQDYFDKDIANQNNLGGYYMVDVNDFVYNPRISIHAPVGPIKRNNLKQGVMSPLYSVFRFTEGNLGYFEYFFQTTTWHKYMHSVANFGARHDRMNITGGDFLKLPIAFPYIEEQKKIADFLNAIDDKITAVSSQLTAAQTFKKGLLQQMFV